MIQVLGQYILVERDPITEQRTEGGIIIPVAAQQTPRFGHSGFGTVVSVGTQCHTVKVGDRVCLKDVAGDDIIRDNRTFTRLREKDLNGILTGE